MKESTIKDVAKHAGVSVGTVSRVINGATNVKKANLVKVNEAIQELGFRPNQYAKGLKSNKSDIIGIIVPNLADEFYRYSISQIEEIATEQGYLPVVLNSRGDSAAERRYLEFLWDKRANGIALVACGDENEDIMLVMRNSSMPIVFFDRRPANHVFDAVYVDKKEGAYIATNYFANKGHQKIALITGPKSIISSYDRFEGYVQALFDHNIQLQNNFVRFGSFTEQFGVETASWWYSLEPGERPTALLLSSVVITYGFLCGAKKLGISIPEDVSIISYGNVGFDQLIVPKLTYLKQRNETIAKTTAGLIFERLHSPMDHTKQVVIATELVEQDSVRDLTKGKI